MAGSKRLPWRRWAPVLCLATCLVCLVQLWSTLSWTRHRGLRPRLDSDVLVRGRTYQVHLQDPLHVHHLRVHEQRLRANRLAKPHLVARRQILEISNGAAASDFLGRDQQDAWPNVNCTTCSLVGFSGHLLRSGLGSAVDGSDCVIRLGTAPSRGYEGDVGRKTTFRVVDAASFHEALRKPRTLNALAASGLLVFGTARPDRWSPKRLPGHVRLLRLKRAAERRAARSLAESALSLGYALSGTEASGLWHAVQLMENVGCSSLRFFGVPDPKLCKRQMDEPTVSNYWGPWSRRQCSGGLDAGDNSDPRLPDPLQLSLADRRALAGWAASRTTRFDAPPWPIERG
ncbi:unnamed protein product [Ixodes hexagonus]